MQRSEATMINNFKKKMGNPENVVIVLGDYSDSGLKHNPPSMTVKIRKIFRKGGYKVYLINEYNTSKKCSGCASRGHDSKMEHFLPLDSTKKIRGFKNNVWKLFKRKYESDIVSKKDLSMCVNSLFNKQKNDFRWKLLRCTVCKAIHNRDHNATKNMMIIVDARKRGKQRSSIFFQKNDERDLFPTTPSNTL
jgi:hypothetical protein